MQDQFPDRSANPYAASTGAPAEVAKASAAAPGPNLAVRILLHSIAGVTLLLGIAVFFAEFGNMQKAHAATGNPWRPDVIFGLGIGLAFALMSTGWSLTARLGVVRWLRTALGILFAGLGLLFAAKELDDALLGTPNAQLAGFIIIGFLTVPGLALTAWGFSGPSAHKQRSEPAGRGAGSTKGPASG